MAKIFIYGDEQRGGKNHIKEIGDPIIQQAWLEGRLYLTTDNQPLLINEKDFYTYGGIYDLNDVQKELLRENIKADGVSLHERVMQADTDQGKVEVTVWIAGSNDLLQATDISDWLVHQMLDSQATFPYFAYGSCMDHDRFQKADIDHGFQKVLGRGIISPYQVKFTMNGPSGGAADLVEEPGDAEGIVYEVDRDTLKYLWKREGVEAGWYRPAVVFGELNNNVQPFLTFVVKNKHPELKPSVIYATEILRGASSHLSEAYINKLKKKLKDDFDMVINGYDS